MWDEMGGTVETPRYRIPTEQFERPMRQLPGATILQPSRANRAGRTVRTPTLRKPPKQELQGPFSAASANCCLDCVDYPSHF